MFVYSVRASTIKFFSVIVLTLLVLVGILALGSSAEDSVYTASSNIDFSGVKTNDERVGFISRFGITVKPEAVSKFFDEGLDAVALNVDVALMISLMRDTVKKARGHWA